MVLIHSFARTFRVTVSLTGEKYRRPTSESRRQRGIQVRIAPRAPRGQEGHRGEEEGRERQTVQQPSTSQTRKHAGLLAQLCVPYIRTLF